MKPSAPKDLHAKFEAKYVKPAEGLVMVAGSFTPDHRIDRRKLFPKAFGVDLQDGPTVDFVGDLEDDLFTEDIAAMARREDGLGITHIDCVSVMEHSKHPWLVASNLERMLPVGGTIYVSVPWIWRVHNYPSDYWRFSPECVRMLFPSIKWHKIMYLHTELSDEVPARVVSEYRWFPRTEVVAFGEKV